MAAVLVAFGCDEPTESKPVPSRFASVKKAAEPAGATFCDKQYSPGERRWVSPPERDVPVAQTKVDRQPAWKWINLWATWCGPCLIEMPLLNQWRDTLRKEGLPIHFELWSVDEDEAPLAAMLKADPKFPGPVRWLRSPDDLPPFLERLGLDRDAAIPIHALVDPKGDLRCVRVGKVAEGAYGTIKRMVGG